MRLFLMMFLSKPMRKLIFGLLSIFSIVLLVKIIILITYDFNRLTEYGLDYLSGLSILFIVSSTISYLTFMKIFINSKKDTYK